METENTKEVKIEENKRPRAFENFSFHQVLDSFDLESKEESLFASVYPYKPQNLPLI